jgi:hypothetical protein
MAQVAELLGIGTAETVRTLMGRTEVDAGARPGSTTADPNSAGGQGSRTAGYNASGRSIAPGSCQ